MLNKTKWILAGGAAAVALSPVGALASGFEVSSPQQGSSVVTTVQSGSLAGDATAGVLPAVDPTAVTPNTANTANTPNTAIRPTPPPPRPARGQHEPPASPVSAKSPVSPKPQCAPEPEEPSQPEEPGQRLT